MAHETPKLKADKRDRLGSRYAIRLRRAGKVPAVVYGHGEDPSHVALEGEAFHDVLFSGAHLIELDASDAKPETCLIKAIQYDQLGDEIIHVDLTRVSLTEKVKVNISIHVVGQENNPVLQQAGMILEQPLTELEVECLATKIPDQIMLDVTQLTADQPITVGDIELPEGVETDAAVEMTVANIAYVQEVEEPEEITEGSEEPEVLSERKEEEQGESASQE